MNGSRAGQVTSARVFDIKQRTFEFGVRIRIARKEARESRYWLRMLAPAEILVEAEVDVLTKEADEFVRILSGIITSATKG